MVVFTRRFKLKAGEGTVLIDITDRIYELLGESKIRDGILTVHSERSVAAIVTMEYEPGCVKDFEDLMERILPQGADYEHQKRWQDNNGHSHMRSCLVGPSKTFPVIDGKICLEPWMQIVFADFQPSATNWEIAVAIVGE